MSKIVEVGRKSLTFYGKYMSEIARNLQTRGVGRIVVKESEVRQFPEPSYYLVKNVELLMSDKSMKRCRMTAHRVFRSHDCGLVTLSCHEPDWHLLSPKEALLQLNRAKQQPEPKPVEREVCFPVPPTLNLFLAKHHAHLPDSVKNAIDTDPKKTIFMSSQHVERDPLKFERLKPLTEEQKSMLYPLDLELLSSKSRTGKNYSGDQLKPYYIRRSDTPGLRWRVELAVDKRDELLKQADSKN